VASRKTIGSEDFVMFLSFELSDAEHRYRTTKREALAILKCPEKVR
jgi:hypothetical protein